MGYEENRLKEPAASKDKQQKEEEVDLTPQEHERALKGAYRSFVIPGVSIDSYFDQAQPRIKTLI